MDIAVASSGQIATASFDNSVGLWTGTKPFWIESHDAAVITVAFLHDDVIISGGDDFALRSWDPQKRAQHIGSHQAKITDIAFSSDRRTIASASWDGSIGLWDIQQPKTSIGALKGHKVGVNAVVFSQDNETLYSAGGDGTIRKWSYKDTDAIPTIIAKHGFGVNTLILNENAGWLAYGAVDGGTRVLDFQGQQIKDFTLGRRPILSMAFSPVANLLAVGDGEGFIMVIDTVTWRIAKDFKATARGPVWAMAFSPDGQNIHAGGIDDVMYSWPIETMDAHGQMGTEERSFLEDPATLSNGERQFKRKCSICHSLTPDSQRRAGPTLHGIFGRAAGTYRGYKYSQTLQNSDIIWSEETINLLFDQGPDHYIPGSKMPMQRIVKAEDRSDLINYLIVATKS